MNIENYLEGLGEQNVQEVKEIVVVKNPVSDVLCKIFKDWLDAQKLPTFGGYFNDIYTDAIKQVKEFSYTAKDIKEFSIKMKVCEKDNDFYVSGLFLAALINESKEENFEIITEHLRKDIYYMGFRLKKGTVTISGNATMPGVQMEGGCMIVKGNVEDLGGLIKGGKMVVEGDLSSTRGFENLELHVNGKLKIDLSGLVVGSGAVYHKGEFVYGTRTIPARI
ncbi:hypothetical protein HY837_06030 [archaeon]|nr:hypothetical protein [archaeon]